MGRDGICIAGRTAFFGGRWTDPCTVAGRHSIGAPGGDPILLCDAHFDQVNAAGLVTDPNISEAEFQKREALRHAAAAVGKPKRWWSYRG